MGNVQRFTKQQIIEAIRGSAGIKVVICDRLQCSRTSLENYIIRYPELADMIVNERESSLDMAELLILQNIRLQGQVQKATEAPVDTADAWKLLDRLGRHRGFTTDPNALDAARNAGSGSKVTIREVVIELPKNDSLQIGPPVDRDEVDEYVDVVENEGDDEESD